MTERAATGNQNEPPMLPGESGMSWRMRIMAEQARNKQPGNGFLGRERFNSLVKKIKETKILGKSIPELGVGIVTGASVKFAARESLIAIGGLASFPLAIAAGAATGAIMAFGREYLRNAAEMPKAPQRKQTKEEYLQARKADGEKIDFLYLNSLESQSPTVAKEKVITNLDYQLAIIKKIRTREIAKGIAVGAVGGVFGSLAAEIVLNIPDWISHINWPSAPGTTAHLQTVTPDVHTPIPETTSTQSIIEPAPVSPAPLNTSPSTENIVLLEKGSNVSKTVTQSLRDSWHREPTADEIVEKAKEVCRKSGIAVSSWKIPGQFKDTALPPGFELVMS